MKDPYKTTLCKLVKKDFQRKETATFLQIIKDPQYFCMDCGRSAAKKKNLCNASSLNNE
ncbi:MAG: hypothetical protein HN600_08320 [Bacteroidetes bacterium]|jgi:hypothetical protein|nr:hypothetical protein [Cytophagia bacterium]MBT7826582.1 hypothetical protein [Bacteroidota bacterium]